MDQPSMQARHFRSGSSHSCLSLRPREPSFLIWQVIYDSKCAVDLLDQQYPRKLMSQRHTRKREHKVRAFSHSVGKPVVTPYDERDLFRACEALFLNELGHLQRVHFAPSLVKRYDEGVLRRARDYILALFINDLSRVSADIIAVAQFAHLDLGEAARAVQVLLNQLFDRSPPGLSYPNKSQPHI